MNNEYRYKSIDGKLCTIYSNNVYDIVLTNENEKTTADVNYKTNNYELISMKLLSDLVKTNSKLCNILEKINKYVEEGIISYELGEELFSILYPSKSDENAKRM